MQFVQISNGFMIAFATAKCRQRAATTNIEIRPVRRFFGDIVFKGYGMSQHTIPVFLAKAYLDRVDTVFEVIVALAILQKTLTLLQCPIPFSARYSRQS